jgi:hypothetical protein
MRRHRTRRFLFAIARAAGVAIAVPATAWAALALWYRLPFPASVRALAATACIVLGLAAILSLFGWIGRRAPIALALALAATATWWSTIEPPSAADWAPDVARQVTGSIDGDRLTLTNVREFDWQTGATAAETWTTREYDLTKLRTLDLFMSYWAGPEIAHVILSFGFEGGDYLAWSIEVRRTRNGEFSPVADLFKSNALIIIAADERDVVRVRSNLRGENVQLYRLKTPPDIARRLLVEYVADANGLAQQPQFYNSLTTNCTTTVVKMMRAVGATIPFDWRLLVNGFLPDYAYKNGALDTRVPLTELKKIAHIDRRARAAEGSPFFSRLIRTGVPSPRDRSPSGAS